MVIQLIANIKHIDGRDKREPARAQTRQPGLEKSRFLGFKGFFFYEDRCRQTRKCDPKASEICIPEESYSSVHGVLFSFSSRKMKEMKHKSHESQFKSEYKI